jgi:ketosteroid isomerase-like protein
MINRLDVERLLQELYAARLAGDLDRLCATFADDAKLEIAGVSYATPMAIRASGRAEIRTWLALLVKTFQLSEQQVLSMIIDGAAAAVHWRCGVRSRITGATVLTELVDVVHVRDGRIVSYSEFFVPR